MRQMILRVAIALVAFGAGVTASAIYNAVFGSSSAAYRYEYPRPAPMKRGGCSKSFRSMSELPPPPPAPVVVVPSEVPAVPDVPPPSAASKPTVRKRVTVKLPDGTVRVVESAVETVERKF